MKLQESERTEFKSIVVTDIKKEIIAFANCDGGKIYIGIEDDGTVIGVKDSDSVALQCKFYNKIINLRKNRYALESPEVLMHICSLLLFIIYI